MSSRQRTDPPSDQDLHTAHLDRARERIRRGDLRSARRSIEQVLRKDEHNIQALMLLGALTRVEGDAEEALELFRQVMDLSPELVEPVLLGASLCIQDLGDPAQALELLQDAMDLKLSSEDLAELTVLRIEALVALDDLEAARRAALELPGLPPIDEEQSLRLGRMCMEIGELDRAIPLLARAMDDPFLKADACYSLGLAHEAAGHRRKAMHYFMQTYELDLKSKGPPWVMGQDAFRTMVAEGLRSLSPEVAALVAQVPWTVKDAMPVELICLGQDPRAPLFLGGLPIEEVEREAEEMAYETGSALRVDGQAPTPISPFLNQIVVYRRNLEHLCAREEDLFEELTYLLESEVRYFFGLPVADDPEGSSVGAN